MSTKLTPARLSRRSRLQMDFSASAIWLVLRLRAKSSQFLPNPKRRSSLFLSDIAQKTSPACNRNESNTILHSRWQRTVVECYRGDSRIGRTQSDDRASHRTPPGPRI